MSDMTLSLLGMYNQEQWEIEHGGTDGSFMDSDHFFLPEDFSNQNRYDLTAIILSETAELEALYPNPATMRVVVPAWSRARLPAWERIMTALTSEYNPVHNYDRYEQETGTDTGTKTNTDTGTVSVSEQTTQTNSASDTVTGQTTGFNSNSFADDKKTTSSGSVNISGQRSNGETRNLSKGETRNLANSRTLHAYGNIGVTTAAEMIMGELDVRKRDIFRIIADEFASYFCLQIY